MTASDSRTPDTIHGIPLAEIDEAALIRDCSVLDAQALEELQLSIAAHGLRLPVEVFPLAEPRPPLAYGLISGLRRLMAFRELHETARDGRYAAIPALIRPAAPEAEALAAMVEENEMRASLSPWERGRIAWAAVREGTFATLDDAVAQLFPTAHRNKRARLRAVAYAVDELGTHLTDPELLTEKQIVRLAAALQAGFGEVIRTALEEADLAAAGAEWRLLQSILTEAEHEAAAPEIPRRPGRPRRLLRLHQGLTLRRERTRTGWCVHLTGPEATSDFVDHIFDEIERGCGVR